jgi:hypothetical protein
MKERVSGNARLVQARADIEAAASWLEAATDNPQDALGHA